MARQEQREIPRLTLEEQQRALIAMDRAERHAKELLARRGGELFPPSWKILNEMRDERMRQLCGESFDSPSDPEYDRGVAHSREQ